MSAVTIRVRYFAGLRERFGVTEEQVAVPSASFAGLLVVLGERHGDLATALSASDVRIAVNDALVDAPPQALGDGDVVAFLPPVTGG